jgi:phage tail sheath protein FI
MTTLVSPGISVTEIDATSSVMANSTTTGAIVGTFRWGPVNERVLISSETDLVNTFGPPDTYTSNNYTWTNHETFFTAADFLSYSNSLYVTRVISETDASTLTASSDNFDAIYPGEIANGIKVSFVTSEEGYESKLFDSTKITTTSDIAYNGNTFTISTTENFANTINENDILRVGNDNVGYIDLYVDSYTISSAINAITEVTTYTYNINFSNRYTLSELDYNNISYKRLWGYANIITNAPDANCMHIIVIDESGDISGSAGSILETYENVSTIEGATLDDGTNNYFKDVLTNGSSWVVVNSESNLGESGAALYGYETLTGGSDGLGETTIPFGKIALGWDLYSEASDVAVSLLIQGKATSTNISNYIINIAKNRKDCVAFISPSLASVVGISSSTAQMTNILTFRNSLQSSSYWFMDTGYKYRYDKYNDTYRWIPLNGDMAGLASKVDPWISPAGYNKGLINNVVKLAFNPNQAQRDKLYTNYINPVITQTGKGTLLFGDKTGMGSSSAFDRINVRRLFIYIEKQISESAKSFLFEINDEYTQTQFQNMVEPFLTNIEGQRGITDFKVVCDSTVNTPDVIDANTFKAYIYIKPARSINYIMLNFVATRTSADFDEVASTLT